MDRSQSLGQPLGELQRPAGVHGLVHPGHVGALRENNLHGAQDQDNTLRLWDWSTGRTLRLFHGHSAKVNDLAVSPDGRYALSGSDDQTVIVWEIDSGRKIRTFRGHTDRVQGVSFTPDGKQAISGAWDKTVRLWDLATGREIRRFQGDSGAFSPDGNLLLSGNLDRGLRLWDRKTGRTVRTFSGIGAVGAVAFSADGQRVFAGVDDGTFKLWERASGKETVSVRYDGFTFTAGLPVRDMAYSPVKDLVMTGGTTAGRRARLWDATTGEAVRTLQGVCENPLAVAFSADGRRVAAVHQERVVTVWDVETGTEVSRFAAPYALNSVDLGREGTRVLIGAGNGSCSIYEADTGGLLASLYAFKDGRWAVIAADGRYDASNPGDVPGVSWVLPDDPMTPLPVEVFMKEYYEPRLLPRILQGEAFPPITGLADLNRVQPGVEILAVRPDPETPSQVAVTVEVAGKKKAFMPLWRRGSARQWRIRPPKTAESPWGNGSPMANSAFPASIRTFSAGR